jgi:hypothetical protein
MCRCFIEEFDWEMRRLAEFSRKSVHRSSAAVGLKKNK